jgi:hypothetical protein
VRWLRWISAGVWIFSWRVIYLEIFRWQHMTRTLRFNPPAPPPGTDIQSKAGLPLIAVCLSAVAAPLVFITTMIAERANTSSGSTPVLGESDDQMSRQERGVCQSSAR